MVRVGNPARLFATLIRADLLAVYAEFVPPLAGTLDEYEAAGDRMRAHVVVFAQRLCFGRRLGIKRFAAVPHVSL